MQGTNLTDADLTLADLHGIITSQSTKAPFNYQLTRGCIYHRGFAG